MCDYGRADHITDPQPHSNFHPAPEKEIPTTKLNLTELDRLEREMLATPEVVEHIRVFPEGSTPLPHYALLQLRPLLDLVDRLGHMLGHMHYCATQWHPRTDDECVVDEWLDDAVAALADYQRAKENK